MRSLAAKLTLAFLFVSLTGTVLVALFVGWQTERQFDHYIKERDADEVAELTQQLQIYYRQVGSWDGVESVAIRGEPYPGEGHGGGYSPGGSRQRWHPVTLVDSDGSVVTGGGSYETGETIGGRELRGAAPILLEGETVGWLLVETATGGPPPDSAEGAFLNNVWEATRWSMLAAAGLALVVGALLARTLANPIRDLTEATEAVAQGELGRQVPVRSGDELGTLARSFNKMSTDLERSTALRRQMTANIAHDLRTPLSALLGYTEALSEGKFQGSPEIYQTLHQESQHLQHLVEDLRTLSLADAGELLLHRQPVPPQLLLERVAQAHGAQAAAQDVTLTAESDPLPPVEVDPERMVQVLGNLVQNALRYTPPGGRVTLSADKQAEQVRLVVKDTGSGIAPDDLPHIWDRLYKGDRARATKGTSGLGLAIARSIVDAHGGSISVSSQLGHGATFTIELPGAAG